MQNLCVIIPFYNEKSFLEESLKRVLDDDIYDQIILSDDCSNDGSQLIAEGFSDKYEKILYIKSNENQGKGNALNQAKPLINTSHVVVHDADLEYFPSDIIEMFNSSKEYPESLILGSRFIGNKERKNVYFRTFIANKVMSLFFSLINFYNVTDVATCYKLMPAYMIGTSTMLLLIFRYFDSNSISIENPFSTKFIFLKKDAGISL